MATELNPGVTDADGSTYADMDVEAVSKEIGDELFAKTDVEPDTEDEPEPEPEPAPVPAAVPTPTPADPNAPAIVPGENREPLSLPKSWKKELSPVWEKMPPDAKAQVVEREAQFMRGFQQYQNGHNAWDALIKPFVPIFQANPNVNPINLMHGLLNTHLTLLNQNQPAAEKAAMVQGLLQEYGIKLDGITALPADFTNLQQRVVRAEADAATLREQIRQDQTSRYQQGVNQHLTEVEKFSADPKNEYFAELGNDILRFLRSDPKITLSEAYEAACWANPVVRAKLVAKQAAAAPAPSPQPRAKNGKFVNIEDNAAVVIKQKARSIDDTINSIVAKHYEPSKH